jgi:hypothetical protein
MQRQRRESTQAEKVQRAGKKLAKERVAADTAKANFVANLSRQRQADVSSQSHIGSQQQADEGAQADGGEQLDAAPSVVSCSTPTGLTPLISRRRPRSLALSPSTPPSSALPSRRSRWTRRRSS